MVALVAVIAVAVTAEMVGDGVRVRNVELADVAVSAALLVEATSKSYVVLCVRPVSVSE
jgi:hypothetical protein